MGQGASTALEDALALARCLRDRPDVEQACAAFEALRRERVEKIVAIARRNGQQKAITNPVGAFVRDLMLPLFISSAARRTGSTVTVPSGMDQPGEPGALPRTA